ncbi:MAG: histidinol dehydrogenase, partial [Candidatus Firestonebacteria bacterium]|nr:histidinol dehydrogenase [Candidatus Firestonebacteria bacterium]
MIEIFKEQDKKIFNERIQKILHRGENLSCEVHVKVEEIIEKVKNERDKALFYYTKIFDKITLTRDQMLV